MLLRNVALHLAVLILASVKTIRFRSTDGTFVVTLKKTI